VSVGDDPRQYFEEQKSAFEAQMKAALPLSASSAGRYLDLRAGWATWIFARQIATGHSIIRLLTPVKMREGETLDHPSIVSLSRNIIESHILISYITEEGISDDQWMLRKYLFDLHDCTSRVRLFKGLKAEKQYKEAKETRKSLQDRLSKDKGFASFEKPKKERLLSGTSFYVDGIRKAAEKAGWAPELFDAIYGYLSSQSHSSPMGFYKMDDRKIDYKSVAPYQTMLIGISLEQASQALECSFAILTKILKTNSDQKS
jgi:hypothetical protein